MRYAGRYPYFDASEIRTYPVNERTNKVALDDLVNPAEIAPPADLGEEGEKIRRLARHIRDARRAGRAVILFTGAHLVKNGLGPLVGDLVGRGLIDLVATNAAGTIHDFELALLGQTSEHVPNALPEGRFGMATEFQYINAALAEADQRELGYGEGLGRLLCDAAFRRAVETRLGLAEPIIFRHPEVSILAVCFRRNVPLTVHAGIGTDVIDQHPNFDGRAKGGCSGRDFGIFTRKVLDLGDGGVFLNVGSAVTGPEVLLKAVSMAANVGRPPRGIITANFDFKEYRREAMGDEAHPNYYYRDHKSIVTRVPEAFGGQGYYVQGDQRMTVPAFYLELIKPG